MARVISDRVTNSVPNAFCERRQFRRLPVAVEIELRVKANPVPIRAKTADISLGGCYVEMALTLSVDTPLKIVLCSATKSWPSTAWSYHVTLNSGMALNSLGCPKPPI